MATLYSLFILEKEITERFFEIVEVDDMGKPSVIEPMDFGIQYFEDPTSIYLDEEVVGGDSNNVSAVVFGMGEAVEDDMDDLKAMGFSMLGDSPPDNWQAGILKQ